MLVSRRQKQTMPTEIRHLRQEDRRIIARLIKQKATQSQIAALLGFSQGTISKEIARNSGRRGYRPRQAHSRALHRKVHKSPRKSVLTEDIAAQVIVRHESKHSPEQISGALALSGLTVSMKTIYTHIHSDKLAGGLLHLNLRINGRRRYRHRNKANRQKIPNRRDISERPDIVQTRERYGDWEADLIEGARGSGYILSLHERKSRYSKLIKLETKTSDETHRAIIRSLKDYRVETITYDNGLEFAKHEAVSRSLSAQGYFCKPYSSWEKGGVENYNGLVRQYYPKGTCFRSLDQHALSEVEAEINNRPRKIFGYQSPEDKISNIAA